MNLKQNKTNIFLASILAAAFAALLLFTPVLGNVWSLMTDGGSMTDGGFEIPAESSVFTFYVTEMNAGSGDWWVYAEDYRNFYAAADFENIRYIAFPKLKISQCPSFRSRDATTWCREISVTHESK